MSPETVLPRALLSRCPRDGAGPAANLPVHGRRAGSRPRRLLGRPDPPQARPARDWNLYRARPCTPVARARYWKLEPSEVSKFAYDESKLLNWDIKLTIGPEEDASFAGVFMYRSGTPRDYEAIRGISYYHNNVPKQARSDLTRHLRSKFGGDPSEKGERVILAGSREIYSGPDIAALASDLEAKLGARAVLTLEFSDFDEAEMEAAGLPAAKLLPIPAK